MGNKDLKKELRGKLMRQEAELPADYVALSNEGIVRNIEALPEYKAAERILFFYSIWNEPDTHGMIERALKAGKTVTLPQSLPQGIMVARQIRSLDELVPAAYNIPSPTEDMPEIPPEEIDFIVVPSIAYDRRGYRLGHGGGYYDRYMKRTDAFRCGIARERMLIDEAPTDEYDMAVHCLVTENEVMRF